jgi:FkbM family methyltransferase
VLTLLFLLSSLIVTDSRIDPTIYQNRFGSYFVPLNHKRPAVEAIKAGRVWEEKTLAYIEAHYEMHTSVIHAGCYFGDMLPFYSRLVGNGRVWAFEPIELNYLCAKTNCELNNLSNVALFDRALSNSHSLVSLQTKRDGKFLGGGSFICHAEKLSGDEMEQVLSITLDDTIPHDEKIGLIQLDIEGHELQALQGAERILCEQHPLLILEVWDNKSQALEQFLQAHGYTYVTSLDGNRVYECSN